MAFCENCGKPIYPLDTVCANCGTPLKQTERPVTVPVPTSESVRSGDVEPPSNSPYAVLSSWGFVGSLLLLCLPLAGFIIAIVWASGGSFNQNRRNLARAYLLIIGLVLALYIVILIAAVAVGGSALLLNGIIS